MSYRELLVVSSNADTPGYKVEYASEFLSTKDHKLKWPSHH